MREAFVNWLTSDFVHPIPTKYEVWQAACEWQKQQDAEFLKVHMVMTYGEKNMAEDCANEILNQGKDNG